MTCKFMVDVVRAMFRVRSHALVCGALLVTGCLDASADQALYSSYVLPPGATVPRLDDDADAVKKLDANDGVKKIDPGAGQPKLIPLRHGFAGGEEVQYWDLGQLAASAVRPMYIFQRPGPNQSGLSSPFDHLDLIDAIPGDTAYSPLRQLYVVYVGSLTTERITSLRALEDAVELGLVQSPSPTPTFMNCVVTSGNTQMQAADDGSLLAPREAYYHGQIVKQFCIGDRMRPQTLIKLTMGSFTPGNAYVVRRQNENQPLDEQSMKKDLNQDGDQLDAEVVFDAPVGSEKYTGVWRNIETIVQPDFKLGDAKTESDLFDRTDSLLISKLPVVDYRDTGVFLNRPLRGMQ